MRELALLFLQERLELSLILKPLGLLSGIIEHVPIRTEWPIEMPEIAEATRVTSMNGIRWNGMTSQLDALLDALEVFLNGVEIEEVDRDLVALVDGFFEDCEPCPSRQGGFKGEALALGDHGLDFADQDAACMEGGLLEIKRSDPGGDAVRVEVNGSALLTQKIDAGEGGFATSVRPCDDLDGFGF